MVVAGLFLLLSMGGAGCTPEPVETDLLVPVIFSDMPRGLTRTAFYTRHIEVRIKGAPDQVQRTGNRNLTYLVDLYADVASDPAAGGLPISPGFYFVPVIKGRLAIPAGIDILQVTPEFITVQLDRQEIRQLPVAVVVAGSPAAGYVVDQISCEPDTVTLTGPASVVKKYDQIATKPVDISGTADVLRKTGSLDLSEQQLSVSPSLVAVTVTVKEEIETRTFTGLAVAVRNGPSTVEIAPSCIRLTLKGPVNAFKERRIPQELKVYIDLEGVATSGVYVRPAVINVPVGLMLVDADPENFTVTVR